MELSDHDDNPIPINTSYDGAHGHIIHHHHHPPPPPPTSPPNIGQTLVNTHEIEDLHLPNPNPSSHTKKLHNVKYKECLKNHAAAIGGNAVDGCGEFLPSGEEGSIEALTCSVCGCHRNFHRREVEGDKGNFGNNNFLYNSNSVTAKKLMLTHHDKRLIRSAVPNQMIMPPYGYNYMGGPGSNRPYILPNSESDDHMDLDEVSAARPVSSQAPAGAQLIGLNHHHHNHRGGGGGQTAGMMMMSASAAGNNKKRFRTKFTQDQKEKMLDFAEKVGWKIQRQEESVVQQFCHDLGIKRRVLKVWMHNNKHNLAKKNINNPNNNNNNNNNNNINNNIDNNACSFGKEGVRGLRTPDTETNMS